MTRWTPYFHLSRGPQPHCLPPPPRESPAAPAATHTKSAPTTWAEGRHQSASLHPHHCQFTVFRIIWRPPLPVCSPPVEQMLMPALEVMVFRRTCQILAVLSALEFQQPLDPKVMTHTGKTTSSLSLKRRMFQQRGTLRCSFWPKTAGSSLRAPAVFTWEEGPYQEIQ